MSERGFYGRKIILINKIQNWFGKSCFVVFKRTPKKNIVDLDSTEYHSKARGSKMKIYRQQDKEQQTLEAFQ